MKPVKIVFSSLVGVAFLAALLLIVSIFMLPVAVKWYANNWFQSQSLHSKIESVEFDLTNGLVILDGLTVKDAQGIHLKIDHLLVQVKLLDLLDRKIKIENVELAGLFIDVIKEKDNVLKYGGILPRKGDKAVSTDNHSDASIPWTILFKEVQLKDVEACYLAPRLSGTPAFHDCIKIDDLEWQGQSEYTLFNNPAMRDGGLMISSTIKVSGFSLKDLRLKRTVMTLDELDIDKVKTAGINNIQVRGISLNNCQVFQYRIANDGIGAQPYLFSLNQISIDSALANNLSNVAVGLMRIEGMQAKLSREADGSLNIQKTIREFSIPESRAASVPEKNLKGLAPISVSLKRLELDGKSAVNIQDASVSPVFVNQLSNITFELDGVDTAEKKKISQIKLGLTVGDHGEVQAKGHIQLLAKRPTVFLKAKLVGIDIAKFTAYANELLQQQVKSGHLDADLDISIKQGIIDATSKITLYKFYVEALGSQQASQYKESIGMPLNTALSLLREKDDRIILKIPVTGDVENPEFSFNDVIRKVSADAIKTAVINYYTPFGLVKLLTAGYKLATALRFEPVEFDPAQSELDGKDKEQLDKLADLLSKRPNIRLVICGQAVKKDFVALYPLEAERLEKSTDSKAADQDLTGDMQTLEVPAAISTKQKKNLIDLAIRRGEIVQQYLVERHGVDPNRLILCNPTFSYADQGEARAEISI